jgi:hypothetical protein
MAAWKMKDRHYWIATKRARWKQVSGTIDNFVKDVKVKEINKLWILSKTTFDKPNIVKDLTLTININKLAEYAINPQLWGHTPHSALHSAFHFLQNHKITLYFFPIRLSD